MGCSSFGQRGAVKVRRWVVVAAVLIGLAATACSSPAEEGLVTGGTEEEFFASLSALMPAMTQHERDALAWAASDLDLAAIHARYPGDLVVKPLHGNGGKAIFKVGADGANLSALIEVFNMTWREPHMIQAFLPDVAMGDKRIVLVDGAVVGAINRLPGEGEIRSNLAVGGSAVKTELTEDERNICAVLGPELKKRGLLFVGIDVIGGKWLTEINVTSPTGLVAIDRFDGVDTAAMIWEAIEGKVDQ